MSEVLSTIWGISDWLATADKMTVTVWCAELKEKMTFCRVSLGHEMLVTAGEREVWWWTTNRPSPLDRVVSPAMANMLDTLVLDHPDLSRITHLYGIFIPESQVECNR